MLPMTTYHHGNLPEAVLRAAAESLEEQGVEGLSLREVARKAKVSHNAPYRHFPRREGLLAALAAQGFDELRRALEAAAGPRIVEAFVGFALERPQRFRLMFGGRLPPETHPELRERWASAFAVVEKAFAHSGGDASIAAAAAWSLMNGLAQALLDGHFKLEQAAAGGPAPFAAAVAGAVRFAVKARRPA